MSVKCYELAAELRRHNRTLVDYMTIDTEGSEVSVVEDFPWREFTVKVVQIEQLHEGRYPAQRGKKARIIRHMTSMGYRYHLAYNVATFDTEDLIFVLDRASIRR